jgi:hypothetical protein
VSPLQPSGLLARDSKIWFQILRDLDPSVTTLARLSSNCTNKLQTLSLVIEGALILKNPHMSEDNIHGEKEKLVAGPTSWPDTRTDWPTDRRS